MNETELYRDTVLNEIVDDGAVRRFAKAATSEACWSRSSALR